MLILYPFTFKIIISNIEKRGMGKIIERIKEVIN
jgi:hypothetical protein